MEEQWTNFMKIQRNFKWSVKKLRRNYGVILRITGGIVGELWSNFRQILRKFGGTLCKFYENFKKF